MSGTLFIAGRTRPWTLWGFLVKLCRGDKWKATCLLYRIDRKAPHEEKIWPWVQAGLRDGWLHNAIDGETVAQVEAWQDERWGKPRGKPMASIGDILRQ